jgi:hypothetical protein
MTPYAASAAFSVAAALLVVAVVVVAVVELVACCCVLNMFVRMVQGQQRDNRFDPTCLFDSVRATLIRLMPA